MSFGPSIREGELAVGGTGWQVADDANLGPANKLAGRLPIKILCVLLGECGDFFIRSSTLHPHPHTLTGGAWQKSPFEALGGLLTDCTAVTRSANPDTVAACALSDDGSLSSEEATCRVGVPANCARAEVCVVGAGRVAERGGSSAL